MGHMTDLISAMPKAELHIHLEGSVRLGTLLRLAERHKDLDLLRGLDPQTGQDWLVYKDFAQFGRAFNTIQSLLRSADDFALVVYEMGADMAAQNIIYREIMVAPYTHTHMQDKGLTIEEILSGLEAGRRMAYEDFGVQMRWVFGFARGLCVTTEGKYDLAAAEQTLAYATGGKKRGVIGLTVGGDERSCPPHIFAPLFAAAKQEGLLSLPHAGETAGATSVWTAVELLKADRIGHGVRSIEDASLVSALRERQIPLDVNPTSNLCLHVYNAIEEHPFAALDAAGLLLTINSDDPALFNTTLNQEYTLLGQTFHYDAQNILRIARQAFTACGAEEPVKKGLLAHFDRWAADNLV